MGSNQGKAKGHLVGLRVATQIGCETAKRKVTYIPGYIRGDGKQIQACCKVTAFINHEKDYGSSIFVVTGWGKLADILAKGMSPGKEFYADVRIKSYYGNVYNNAGHQVMNPDGSQLQTLRHNFVIEDFLFGDDGRNFIDNDILMKKRPANWNTEAGKGAWLNILERRNAAVHVPGQATYGYAKVTMNKAATGQAPVQTNTGMVTEAEVRAAAEQANALKTSFDQTNGAGEQAGQPDLF